MNDESLLIERIMFLRCNQKPKRKNIREQENYESTKHLLDISKAMKKRYY
jgi:hypothetical protein